jgi:hypothetical protein
LNSVCDYLNRIIPCILISKNQQLFQFIVFVNTKYMF